MPQQNEPRLLWTTPRQPNWVGPNKRAPLENFTGSTLFSTRQHNKLVKLINVLYDLHLVAKTGGGPNDTKSSEAKVQFSDDNLWIELDLNDLLGAAGGLTLYDLVHVHGDYLECSDAASTVNVAKPFKLRQSLVGVYEFGVPYQFFYGDGSSVPQGSAVWGALGITPDGENVMRLKTSDAGQAAFPQNTSDTAAGGGYDKSLGELELVIPIWTTLANSPNDIIFAANANTTGVTVSGTLLTQLSVGDSREWAKIDQALSKVTTKTADYNAASTDNVILGNGTLTVTLVPGASIGSVLTVKNIGGGVVTIDAGSGATIDGYRYATLSSTYESVTLVNGALDTWFVV